MYIALNYDLLKSWKMIIGITLVFELIYQSIVYLHPENLEWINSEQFSLANTLQYIFIDQFLIECITVTILFSLMRIYATHFSLTALQLKAKNILYYQIKFLPVYLVAFFLFAPITLTIRFFYHQYSDPDWVEYLREYSYSIENYFNYLPAIILIGYTGLNVNLLYQYNQQLGETQLNLKRAQKPNIKNRLWATDEFGELFLDTDSIQWIERKDRKSMAISGEDQFRLKESITELEAKLDPNQFLRINRSTIVKLSEVNNYSYWENDKYILRMKNSDQEFVMSRDRLKKIKDRFLSA